MEPTKYPSGRLTRARIIPNLFLVLALLLISPAQAGISNGVTRGDKTPGNLNASGGSALDLNQPPVAVDDSGPGFITLKNRPFTTGSVLANDYDPDGEPLFVKTFDASSAKGLVDYLSGGSLDATFGSGGKVTTDLGGDYYAGPLLVQPDDRILLAGYVNINSPEGPTKMDIALARYYPNGSLDASFNATGVVTTTFDGDAWISALALQPDGKILVVGGVNTAAHPGSYPVFALARYHPDGSLDETFGSDGRVTTDFGGGGAIGSAVVLQPDGKIVVAGWAYTGVPLSDYHNFAVARYNPDGSPDASFGSGGRVISSFGNSSACSSAALQTDGKIVVAGFSGNWPASDFAIARYNLDGSLDTSFHYSGLFTTRFSGEAWGRAIAIQPDGKILVAGGVKPYADSIYYDFAMARYNADGSLDTYFTGDGLETTDFGHSAEGLSLVLQPDRKIIAAGDIYDGVSYEFAAVRYNPDGSLDTNFNGNGMVTTSFGDTRYQVSVGMQSDGKIVLGGSANHTFVLARYNSGESFRYDPNGKFDDLAPGEKALDTFTYAVSDGVLTDTAKVTITINGANQVFLPIAR